MITSGGESAELPSRLLRLLHACSLLDGICNLIWGEFIHANGDMRGAVKGQTALVAAGEIGLIGEDGAGVFSAAATGEGGGQLHFEMDEECAGSVEQEIAGFGALNGATAEGQHQFIAGDEASDGRILAIAECWLAMVGEKLGDLCTGFGFDYVIDVDKTPAEACGDERADCGFAGAHEAGEDDAARRRGWAGCGLEISGQMSLVRGANVDSMYSV